VQPLDFSTGHDAAFDGPDFVHNDMDEGVTIPDDIIFSEDEVIFFLDHLFLAISEMKCPVP
jgi:hypothetical protein